MLFYEVWEKGVFYTLKFVSGYFYWLETIFAKKSGSFIPIIGGEKSVSGYSKTKKKI